MFDIIYISWEMLSLDIQQKDVRSSFQDQIEMQVIFMDNL